MKQHCQEKSMKQDAICEVEALIATLGIIYFQVFCESEP
ncbi:hypothetical protein PU02_0076 [Bartonella ancashensis]|uniref:Uncharacterized protein n=1 Tax=Bartonella ancashensis TaxID=1318743 RepID=A0A0M5KS96_9HYPH|nr:hypothetical protein PU02_0076 [Bartonella ancashensis]